MPFAVGDRVRAIGRVDGLDMEGRRGTVVVLMANSPLSVGVRFDEHFDSGHDLYKDGESWCRSGFGRWGAEEDFCYADGRPYVRRVKTAPDRHVFRKGDRVIKTQTKGDFDVRPALPIGATGTIWWSGPRIGHVPHIIVLLDEKYGMVKPYGDGVNEYVDREYYRIPDALMAHPWRRRWHVCPIKHFKYAGRRINPEKMHEYK